jgi:hypothetical protein
MLILDDPESFLFNSFGSPRQRTDRRERVKILLLGILGSTIVVFTEV